LVTIDKVCFDMKRCFLSLLPSFLIIVFSCKKQDAPPIETNYDTIPVNSPYIIYGLLENTILTLDAYSPDAIGYKWTPGGYETPSINVDKDGIYIVKVTTHASIMYTYQVTVYYQGSDCYIPSSFTPNGDGINDYWYPSFINIKDENFLLNIYNAENVKLFSTSDKNNYWDGKYNGDLMPAGYYYYTILYQTIIGEKKSLNGMLQLVL
jgi:gliding motility-associated-like protein